MAPPAPLSPTSAEKIVSNRLSLSSFTTQAASLSLGSGSSRHAPGSSSGSGSASGGSEAVLVEAHDEDGAQASNSAAWFGALDGDSEYGDGNSDDEEVPVVAPAVLWSAAVRPWAAQQVPDRRASMPPQQHVKPYDSTPQAEQQDKATRRSNGTLKLQRRPTGGGILSRLRRINKKEAKATPLLPLPPRGKSFDVVSPARTSSTETASVPPAPAPTPAGGAEERLQSASPEPLPMRGAEEQPLQFRDAPTEHVPYFIDEAGRPSHERVHSLQPSLVDDESILERSELGSDEEEQKKGVEALVLDPEWLEGKVREKREVAFGEAAKEEGDGGVSASSSGTIAEWAAPGHAQAQVVKHARQATAFADAHSRQPTDHAAEAAQSTLPAASVTPAATYAALTIAKQTGWQEEEDAATPKGHESEASRTSYFDAPPAAFAEEASTPAHSRYSTVATASSALTDAAAASSASSLSHTAASAPPMLLSLPPQPAHTWLLGSELSAQHLFVFLREMVTRQLRWEASRAWLLSSIEAPSKPAALGRDDLAIFKRDAFEANLPQPLLPFVRFLLTRALLPCPLFAPTSHGAPDVQAWYREGAAQLLKRWQRMSLSEAVDRQGEGDGTRYNSKTTLDVLRATASGLVVSYLTALVRRSLPAGAAEPIPYPKDTSAAMPVDEYYAHRLPAAKLKQGGFELDVVGLRARSANDCEFVICLKRYGHPYAYVIRDENDFFEYARGLSAELGPRARVRPLPRSGTHDAQGDGSVGTMAGSGVAALLGSAGRRDSISSTTSAALARPQAVDMSPSLSSGSAAGAGASRLRMYGAGETATPAAPLQRPALPRVDSSDSSSAAFGGKGHARAFGANAGASSSQLSLTASERGMPRGRSTVHLASPPLLQDPATPFAAPSGMASSRTLDSNTADSKRSRIFSSGSKRAPSPGPTLRYRGSNGSLKDKQPPAFVDPSAHHEARRHELRNWLRDALSVRGAGHASETKTFLATGAFGDREMRPGTKADVELRARIDEERGAEREAVAAGSAEEVLELHEELQGLWRECVDQGK